MHEVPNELHPLLSSENFESTPVNPVIHMIRRVMLLLNYFPPVSLLTLFLLGPDREFVNDHNPSIEL